MLRNFTFLASSAVLVLGALVVGCSQSASTTPPQSDSAAAADGKALDAESRAKVEKWLAQLSPEDRALAEAQKTCPVSGEPLGSMGPGIKVQVDGKDVFVCCEGCVQPLKDNPADHLGESAAEHAGHSH
jgi:hypothetical protein